MSYNDKSKGSFGQKKNVLVQLIYPRNKIFAPYPISCHIIFAKVVSLRLVQLVSMNNTI